MRLSYRLTFSLCGLLSLAAACGSDKSAVSNPDLSSDEDSANEGTKDAGGKKKDAGKPPATGMYGGGGKDASNDDSDDPNTCEKLQLPSDPLSPEILIVQDRSGSMVGLGDMRNAGKNRWAPSVSALKKLTSELTDTVAFGLMLFPAPGTGGAGGLGGFLGGLAGGGGGTAGGPGCSPGMVNVEVATGNAAEIASVLDMSAPDVGATPTAASLDAAKGALDKGICADCRDAPKYVLLVTDGQPTCGANGAATTAPEDIDNTNAAIDELAAAGIKTYVIGYDTASDPDAAAAMDSFAMHGGTDHHLPVEDEASLLAELTRIAGSLVPCEFELSDKAQIPDPSYVRVEIDGMTYNFGTDWHLEENKVVLTPEGGACPKLRDAKLHSLKITRECERIQLL
jgi:hypothetical protein